MDALRVNHISKQYRMNDGEIFNALKSTTLSWHAGESAVLCGESGSGKSTLARLLLGLDKPSSGEIWLGEASLAHLSFRGWRRYRPYVQGVFQDASGSLNPGWSTYRNMEEGLVNLTGLSSSERKREVYSLMERFGLRKELLQVPVHQLSGGEQRRVALVRALAVKPTYLIMDEVLAGLDFLSADAVMSTLEDYRNSYGCAYLLITHDMYSAKRMGDTIYVMEQGNIVRKGIRTLKKMKK